MRRIPLVIAVILALATTPLPSVAMAAGLQLAQAEPTRFLVLFSSVPTYRKGEQLVPGAVVTLSGKGDRLVLMDGAGATRTITGPAKTNLAQPGGGTSPGLLAVVAHALADAGASDTVLAVARDAALVGPFERAWSAEPGRAPSLCASPTGVVFLRFPRAVQSHMELSTAGGMRADIERVGTTDQLLWPRRLSLSEGAQASALWAGLATPANVAVHLMPASLRTIGERLQFLAQQGCAGQAAQLVEALFASERSGLSLAAANGQRGSTIAHIGSELDLVATAGQDGFLACLYRSGGTLARIHPARGDESGAVHAGIPVRVPALGATPLTVTAPVADDLVTCVLADKPAPGWLPPPLREGNLPEMSLGASDPVATLAKQWPRATLLVQVRP